MLNGNQIYDEVVHHKPRMFAVRDAATPTQQRAKISQVSEEHQCDFEAPLPSARLSNFAYHHLAYNSLHEIKYDYIFFDVHMHGDGLQGAVLAKANNDYIDQLLSCLRNVNRMTVTLGTVALTKYCI